VQQWNEDARAAPPAAPPPPALPPAFCEGCGAALEAGQRFCTACGRPRVFACSWCNATLQESARFCVACGRPAVRDHFGLRRAVAGKPIAGFGIRAGVYVLDNLIVTIPFEVAMRWAPPLRRLGGRWAEFDDYVGLYGLTAEAWEIIVPLLWFYAALMAVTLVAMQWMWDSIGWSPAQRAIGLRIIDAAGRPPGWRRGLGRTAASWLSAGALGLGYLWAAWHAEKRTWHDSLAGTWVVDVRDRR